MWGASAQPTTTVLGSKRRRYKHSTMRHLAPPTSTHMSFEKPPTDHLPPSTHGATYGYKESRPDGMTIHHHADVSRHAQSILPNGHGPRLRWHLPHTPRTKACRWRDHGGDGYM